MKFKRPLIELNKRGDVSSTTVVTTVILLAGFAILVYFLYSLFLGGRVDKEACHESVVLRGTAPTITGLKGAIPLKCSEEKICITTKMFGGKCAPFENSKGVTTVTVKNEDQIARTIAQSVVECWTMMGEGKISIFSNWFADIYGVGSVYPSCVVCSKIAFDSESLSKSGIDARKIDVSNYMKTHLMPDKEITYFEFLTGQAGKMSIGDDLFETLPAADVPDVNSQEFQTENPNFAALADTQQTSTKDAVSLETVPNRDVDFKADTIGVIFMQISVPSKGEALKNLGYTALGFLGVGASVAPGSFFKNFMPTLSLSKVPTTTTAVTGEQLRMFGESSEAIGKTTTVMKTKVSGQIPKGAKIAAAVGVAVGIFQQVSVVINQGTASGKCADVSTGDEGRTGCSVVRAVKYEPADLETYCGVVESIP